jgi:chemotaxis protein histidine kinase CheA
MQAMLLQGLTPDRELELSADELQRKAEEKEAHGVAIMEEQDRERAKQERAKIAAEEDQIEAEAAAAADESREQREAAKKAEADKKAMSEALDSVFAEDSPKPKSGGGGKPLAGWRLKKALRKAASEAEAKELPVEKWGRVAFPILLPQHCVCVCVCVCVCFIYVDERPKIVAACSESPGLVPGTSRTTIPNLSSTWTRCHLQFRRQQRQQSQHLLPQHHHLLLPLSPPRKIRKRTQQPLPRRPSKQRR